MEFDILLLLTRRPGQVFTARQIYEAVAADSYDAGWTGISSMVDVYKRQDDGTGCRSGSGLKEIDSIQGDLRKIGSVFLSHIGNL